MVGDYIAQQGTQVSFVANGIQFPTSQQASEYNKLIAPLPAQHQRNIAFDYSSYCNPIKE